MMGGVAMQLAKGENAAMEDNCFSVIAGLWYISRYDVASSLMSEEEIFEARDALAKVGCADASIRGLPGGMEIRLSEEPSLWLPPLLQRLPTWKKPGTV
jgi:hypothetical protein